MKKVNSILALAIGVFAFACQVEEGVSPVTSEIPQDIQNKVLQLGFNPEGMRAFQNGYLVEGDIYLTEASMTDMKYPVQLTEEHYHTTNLVTGMPRVLSVYMDPGFDSYMQNAFDLALSRYNALNLDLSFQRSNSAGADIDILSFYENSNTLGFSAGFPTAGGDPASPIQLNTRYYNSSTQRGDAATVIAHEIGHAIGFRHTDYMARRISCGGGPSGGNEGSAGVGAIWIPGTPQSTRDVKAAAPSWMLACSDGTDRAFTSDDVVALTTLY